MLHKIPHPYAAAFGVAGKEIAIEAVKAVLSGQISQTQAATKFNVAGVSSVAKWLKVYKEHGEEV